MAAQYHWSCVCSQGGSLQSTKFHCSPAKGSFVSLSTSPPPAFLYHSFLNCRMPCPVCGASDGDSCSCIPARMGQRRRQQGTEISSLRQVQQTLASTPISQSSGTVVSAGGDQHALKSGPARPDHAGEATRRDGSWRAPESGSSPQPRLQAAPACNEGDSPGHGSASIPQHAVYSWPRRTRVVQQASQSGFPQQEVPISATTGQTASCSRDAQHNFTGERNEQPHTASQKTRASPSLRNPPSEAPAAETRSLILGMRPIPLQQNPSSAVDEPSSPFDFQILVEAQFMIAPKAEEYYRPAVEAFVGLLAENHNRLVGSPHPAMVKKMQRSRIPSGKAENWHVYMGSVQPPTISVPRKSCFALASIANVPTDRIP